MLFHQTNKDRLFSKALLRSRSSAFVLAKGFAFQAHQGAYHSHGTDFRFIRADCSASNSISRKRQIFLYTSGRETHFILSGLALFWLQKHFILFLSVQKKPSCQKRLLINNFLCSRILSGILFPLYMPGSSCSSFPALF